MTRSRVAWGIAGLDIVAFLVASLIRPGVVLEAALPMGLGIASFTAVGALLCTRVPGNPVGVLLLAAGSVLVLTVVLATYADLGTVRVPPWPASDLARIVGNAIGIYPFVIAFIGVPLVYPDGHLPSRGFRWVVRIAIANMVAWALGAGLGGPSNGAEGAIPGGPAQQLLTPAIEMFVLVSTLISFGGAVVAVSVRFRRGDPSQREQIKWLVAIVGLGTLIFVASLLTFGLDPAVINALSTVAALALFALPIVIAIAILRYRLYEIDRIISRTIAWAVVTGVLGTVFAATVVGLQSVLSKFTQGETLAVAGSTLVAFAIFQPVRRRVQSIVDRRFNRARYDAEHTATAFAGRQRDQTNIAGLRVDLVGTIDSALHPQTVGVWIRPSGRGGTP
jgi:drug/metabolite transporter (DMT)-like permease